MSEFTKISIHNHLGGKDADCTIDKTHDEVSSFDLSVAYKQVDEAAEYSFELLGQTNHNNFDAASFCLLRRYCSMRGITLVPGVEIDLQNWKHPNKTVHTVLLMDPSTNPWGFQSKLRACYRKNAALESSKKPQGADCYFLTIDQLSELATFNRSIVCVHGTKQKQRSVQKNPEMASELLSLSRFLPVATEDNKSFHKIALENSLKDFLSEEYCEWLSDAANMSSADQTSFKKFSEEMSPTYIWAGSSFDDLFYSVLVGDTRVLREEDLIKPTSFVSKIIIDENSAMGSSEIDCSHGINAIIGPSGSGKTMLLDLIKSKLMGEHLSENTSNVSNYKGMCDPECIHLYDSNNRELNFDSSYKVVELENLYQKIIKAYSSDPAGLLDDLGLSIERGSYQKKLDSFRDSMNVLLANKRVSKRLQNENSVCIARVGDAFKFIDTNKSHRTGVIDYKLDARMTGELKTINQKVTSISEDIDRVDDVFKALKEIASNRALSNKLTLTMEQLKTLFTKELGDLKLKYEKQSRHLELKQRVSNLIYAAVKSYNSKISLRSTEVANRETAADNDLQTIAKNCLEIKKLKLTKSVPCLDKEELTSSLKLSSESSSVKLEVEGINLELSDADSIRDAFLGAIGNKPKVNKSRFNPPYDLTDPESVDSLVEVFFTEGFSDSLNFSLPYRDALDYTIKIKTDGNNFMPIDELSAGMLSKIYVSNFLDEKIEDSGSNTVIVFDQPESNMDKLFLLNVLASKFDELRKTHQLFIATHEPLLVVNADSNEIILAENDKTIGKENHITYSNKSFVGARGKSELVENIAKLIDGGSKAVKRRSDIYEGMKS